MIARLRSILSLRPPDEIRPGHFVRKAGKRGAGMVESITADHAVVAWDRDKRDIIPLASLRRVRGGGTRFDSRRWL